MKGIWLIIIQFVCVWDVLGLQAKYILSDVEVDSDDNDDDDSNFCCLFVKVLSKAPKILEKGNSILNAQIIWLSFHHDRFDWIWNLNPMKNFLYDDRSLSLMPNIQKLTNTSSSTNCVLCKFSSRISIRGFFFLIFCLLRCNQFIFKTSFWKWQTRIEKHSTQHFTNIRNW